LPFTDSLMPVMPSPSMIRSTRVSSWT
jgi:hypothetical protein